jgi:hypothetical protein
MLVDQRDTNLVLVSSLRSELEAAHEEIDRLNGTIDALNAGGFVDLGPDPAEVR